jgi:ligand-binding sensor domain-containing protein
MESDNLIYDFTFGPQTHFHFMHFWKPVFSLCLLLLFVGQALGNYFFQHYTVAQGLPSNRIKCFHKDRQGFLWIGTENGLSQFDGFGFRNFLHNPLDSHSIPNNEVRSITEDKQGRLWLGLWGGVAIFNPKTQKFQKVKLSFANNYDKVLHIFFDSKNRIWISTTEGNYLFSQDGKLIRHWEAGKGKHDLPHNTVVFTQEDQAGNIWISGRCGLCRFREASLDFDIYPDNNPPYTENNAWLNSVNEGSIAGNGILWYGSWANGLRRIDPKTGSYQSWLTKPEFKGHGAYNVISGTAEFDGKIWVASHDQGLGFLDERQNKLLFLKDLPIQGYDMPIQKVNGLLADGPVLWIATPHGVYKYDLRRQLFQVFKVPDLKSGSCLPEIQSVIRQEKDQFLLGTWTCGTFQFHSAENVSRPWKLPLPVAQKDNWNIDIKHLMEATDGSIWVSSSHGLFHLKNDQWFIIRPDPKKNDLCRENYFFRCREDAAGQIWAASSDGIVKVNPITHAFQKWKLSNIAQPFENATSDIVQDLDIAPNGDIWFLRKHGGEKNQVGFTIWRKAAKTWVTYVAGRGPFRDYPFPQTCSNLKATSDGQIFVSGERGLVRFQGNYPSQFEAYSSFHGLIADQCYDLAEDAYKKLWILATNGLSCFDLTTGKFRTFTESDGLPQADNFGLSTLKNGNIAIGHNNEWLTLLFPDRQERFAKTGDQIKLTLLEIENQAFLPGDSFQVSAQTQVVKLAFSPLNFFSVIGQAFSIEIDHSGKITRYETPSNQITLSDIRPGWYDITVSAQGLKPVKFHLYKEPRFWQTTWFLVVSILIGFMVITGFLLYRQRQILRKKERERHLQFQMADMQMAALRSQIDAHFIFNALNAINQFIWQKLPEQAADYLTQFARLMRINLEHTRTDWVSLEEEFHAVEYYFNLESLAIEPTPVLIWDVENLPHKAGLYIPPMLLQPIVENAFKHGFQLMEKQGVLRIKVEKKGDMLLFTAKDNGPGPKTGSKKDKYHKSLATKIMDERLDLLNRKSGKKAEFELTRENENGEFITVSRLLIPYQGYGEDHEPQDFRF